MPYTLMPLLVLLVSLTQTPAGWENTSTKGAELILQGKASEAVTLFEKVVRTSPDFADGHLRLADAHVAVAESIKDRGASQAAARRQHLETAATHYKRAIELGSVREVIAKKSLVDLYRKDGLNQLDEAEKYARQLLGVRPQSVVWHHLLAEVLIDERRYDEAATVLHKAVPQVDEKDRALLAMTMIDAMIKTPEITGASARTLAEDSLAIVDRALKAPSPDRQLYAVRSGALKMLADRVEQNPAKKKALLADSDLAFDKFRELAGPAPPEPPPAPPTAWELNQMKASTLWDQVRTQKSLPAADAQRLLNEASALLDEALKLKPDYVDSLVFKSLVLKEQAAREPNPQKAKALLAEADTFTARAKAILAKR